MLEGPNIARIAALMGDPSRANMLAALMDGRALTATELAMEGGVTKQTGSGHLARLVDGGLLIQERQGRHRYYRLADQDVALALEALMGVAARGGGRRVRPGPKDPAMRRARVCYDHLAGEVAVSLFQRWIERGWLLPTADDLQLTPQGSSGFQSAGIDVGAVSAARRPTCKNCLDWSARRHHLAGGLGRAVFDLALEKKWARRVPGGRLVHLSDDGEQAMRRALGA